MGKKIILLFILFLFATPSFPLNAKEAEFPVAFFNKKELKQIREWEKKWVGKKIDKTNIELVAEFLPEAMAEMYRNPEMWGAPPDGLYFTIVAYTPIIETTGIIEATKKYAPQVQIDENGNILNSDKIAGFPFPAPKDGKQIAYNIDFQNHGDDYTLRRQTYIIDPIANTEKLIEHGDVYGTFIHRTELDDRPTIDKNVKRLSRGRILYAFKPRANSCLFQLRFIDDSHEDIAGLWLSPKRRMSRPSYADSTQKFYDNDIFYEDDTMWDGGFFQNNYFFKGEKEILLARHQDTNKIQRNFGQAIPSGLCFERCKAYVVEVENKNPDYLYKKRVWYVDPETYLIHWQEVYDRGGQLWKVFCQPTQNIKTKTGKIKNFMVGNFVQDFKKNIGAASLMKDIAISNGITTKMFNLNQFSLSRLKDFWEQ